MGNRASFDDKKWSQYGETHEEATIKALDDFFEKVSDDSNSMAMYQQVLFEDLD